MDYRQNFFLPLLGLLAAVGIVISAVGIRDSFEAIQSMQALGISAAAIEGDLQYYMQEGRRRFIYALTTPDPNQQLPYVRQSRAADAEVHKRFQSLSSLQIQTEALSGAGPFEQRWLAYLAVRDEIISLILEGRNADAIQLESKRGTDSFENASAALQDLRHRLSDRARAQAGVVQSALRRVAVELLILLLTLCWFGGVMIANVRAKRDQQLAHERERNEALSQSARIQADRGRVLELTGTNEPLPIVIDALCKLVQDQLAGCFPAVSIYLDGQLKEITGPTLPAAFVESHYVAGGPVPWGASWAAHESGKPVYALISDEPEWHALREAALRHGFLSCWSDPILSSNGHTLGTIDVYFQTAREPDTAEKATLRIASQLAAIAIDHRRLYEVLSFQAQRDALTELPNRRLFQDRLEKAIGRAERDGHMTAVLMIDLDRFKQVNDQLGHRAGDSLLRTIAHRLSHAVLPADTVARVGGDEFTIVLNSVSSAEEAEQIGARVLAEIAKPVLIGEQESFVSASIGISIYPSDGKDTATLIRNSDLALYQVKSRNRNGCQLYGPQIGAVLRKRMSMEKALAPALQNREFHLEYQPKTDMHRRLIGLEALIRWESPEFGRVGPSDFIPVAEDTGMIVAIGEWVLREACRQSKAWQENGYAPLKIAVNVSARQLTEETFVASVQNILAETGLRPDLLEIELTESTLMEYTGNSLPRLRQLRELGITMAIDDFGTGYSSLSYLQKLPVASVKIDQSFIREISDDSTSTIPVIQAIIELAHGMGLDVVAEGVETERQLHTLRVLGCDAIQGFLIQRPSQPGEIEPLFQTNEQMLRELDQRIREENRLAVSRTPTASLQ